MLVWIKRHWILSIFLLFGVTPASLNYSGFCWEQKRWLSDEEFLLAVAGYASSGKFLQKIRYEKGEITNEDVKKFLKENPECCSFIRGDIGMYSYGILDFINRITGSPYASAEVEYERSDEERKQFDWNTFYYTKYLTINTCGKAYHYAGEGTDRQHSRYKNK